MKSVDLQKLIQRIRFNRAIVLLLLLVLVAIGAVPSYLTGNWSWTDVPDITNLTQIRNIRKTGLDLPSWQTVEQKPINLGGHEWSYQELKGDYPKPIVLLMLPQGYRRNQPQVEWVDIDGVFQWQTDSYTKLNFKVQTSPLVTKTDSNPKNSTNNPTIAEVEARFFRAWTQQQTFAVVQWYAWPKGGNPATRHWFWLDQIAQLSRQRVPWVAVCLQIPIEPLGNLEASRPLAESLSKMIQTALITGPFSGA
ncbi:MAG TPA: cyanoexosortase B system-associated protein [Cyanobacteria bacterium UBA11370]|nr:cyanoexosortase B system-associated protein [Cyanobacteria bacterium UBA11370]